MRHSGGEYAWIVTAGSPGACETRWMSAAENVKSSPAVAILVRGPAERQALLEYPAGDDGDRAGRQLVVVEAGVLLLAPADQPDRDVVVARELLVAPLLGVVLDEVLPGVRPDRDVADELQQFGLREVVPVRALVSGHGSETIHNLYFIE